VVLNSVAVQGLAARVKASLEADGWTVSRTGNSSQRGLTVTKVYYGRSGLRSTAKAVVSDLQFGTAVLDAGVAGNSSIFVVLGQDAQ
jgi:hypothetical protein